MQCASPRLNPYTLSSLNTALLLAGLYASPAQAAGSPVVLQPLTITATRQAQPIAQVPSTVTVAERDQLDRATVTDIQELVRYEPGVWVGGTGTRSGISGYNIRGIDDDRILTQIDGIEVPTSHFSGPYAQSSRNYVDPEIVKRVEILRGPASVLYGSNAIGGAVSYFTLDPEDILDPGEDFGARLKTGYSSRNTSHLRSMTLAGRQDRLDALLHLSQRNGREIRSYGEEGGFGLGRTAANPEQAVTRNVLAKLGWNPADDARLVLTYEHYRDEHDQTQKSAVGGPFNLPVGGLYRFRESTQHIGRERFGLNHELGLGSTLADRLKWSFNYQVAKTTQHTRERYVPFDRDVLRVRDSDYQERQWVFDAQLDKAFTLAGTEHRLTYGTTLKRQQVTGERSGSGRCLQVFRQCRVVGADSPKDRLNAVSDFPDPTVHTASLFIQDQISREPWTLLPGLRYDYTHMAPRLTDAFLRTVNPGDRAIVSDDSKAWHRLTPRLGLTYAFDARYTGYGQYSEGFRTPTAKMLYGRFDNAGQGYRVEPNPNLKPERSRSIETGLRGRFDSGQFDLAVFYNQYRDFINEDAIGAGADEPTFQANNIKRAVIHGAELKGRLSLDALGAPAGLYTQGSLAWLQGRNQDSGQPLNSVSPLTGILGLGYEQKQAGAVLNWTLAQRKTRVDDTAFNAPDGTSRQFKSPGFGVLDLTGFYKVSDDITLNAGLYNLADKKYWLWNDVRGYDGVGEAGVLAPAHLDRLTQPGRHFSVNAVWNI
jgi:hemoglobin/transferrin/lactoferrin receptor protein